jgi:putative FmdB family regulatory protein
MPIYEYRCGACGHELDALQKLSDGPLRKCPKCSKSQLRRLVSAPSFRLKGGGWYETDFKANGEKKRNLVETASGDSSESSAATSSADSAKDSASKEAPPKVAEAKSSDSPDKNAGKDADKKPKPEKAGTHAAKKRASMPKPKPRAKSARA